MCLLDGKLCLCNYFFFIHIWEAIYSCSLIMAYTIMLLMIIHVGEDMILVMTSIYFKEVRLIEI